MREFPKIVLRAMARQATRGSHPEAELLSALADNSLPDGERRQVLGHLADCADCRQVLYLSLDEGGQAQKVLALAPDRSPRVRWLWGALFASLALLTAVTLATYERSHARRQSTTAAVQETSQYAKLSDENELDRRRDLPAQKKPSPGSAAKVLPRAKHMEAKPQVDLDFEPSGQVRIVAPASSRPDSPPLAKSKAREYYDQVASSGTYGPAASAPANESARKKDAGESAMQAAKPPAPAPANAVRPQSATVAQSARGVQHARTGAAANERVLVSRLVPLYQWTLSPEGAPLRSADSGQSWQAVNSQPGGVFRSLSAVGSDVWVGGAEGSLYHSPDSGQTWEKVVPAAAGRKLEAEVIRIDFSDRLNGTVTAAGGERWKTSDGGQTWRRD